MAMVAYKMAEDGMITGNGPADPNAKRLLQADGWQPYSIKVGDKYYSYNRLDPLATVFGTAADLAEKQKAMTDTQSENTAFQLIASVLTNMDNKTFLSGLSDAFDAYDAAKKGQSSFLENYAQQRIAGITVPAIASQTAQAIDPVQHDNGQDGFVEGLGNAIESRIPFASQNVQARRDVLGQVVTRGDALGPDVASPIKGTTAKNDEVIKAIQDSGARVGKLTRRVKGVKLNDKQWDDYQRVAGDLTRQYIKEELTSPDWKTLSQEEQKKAIEGAKTDARKAAREQLGLDGEEDDD